METLVHLRILAASSICTLSLYAGYKLGSLLGEAAEVLALALFVSMFAHLKYRLNEDGVWDELKRVANSHRWDLVAISLTGFVATFTALQEISIFKDAFEAALNPWFVVALALPGLMMLSKQLRPPSKLSNQSEISHFILDNPIKSEADDRLGYADRARSFAELVARSAKTNVSQVFGIDAPWGTGKTSFVNLCEPIWKEEGCLVHRFEPLRYAEDKDLASRFVRELAQKLQESHYAPEIRPAFARYSRLLKGKAELSFFGTKLSFSPGDDSVDDSLKELEGELKRLAQPVIVVVDDLDRLSPKASQNVLFAVKRSFSLVGVVYVLCYDTDKLEQEAGIAREFLEKFVGVKIGLFLGAEQVVAYMRDEVAASLRNAPKASAETFLAISGLMSALQDVYKKNNARHYQRLIGDVRKIKRLVNAMTIADIQNVELDDLDFDKNDLLNLLLLYINYPTVFRTLYLSEGDGQIGIFGVSNSSSGNTGYKNHKEFSTYCESLHDHEPAQFLLKQLFDVEVLNLNGYTSRDSEFSLRVRACFNGSYRRNLERYLDLIVNLATPSKTASLSFFLRKLKNLETEGIEKILEEPEFDRTRGVSARAELFSVIGNRVHNLPRTVGASLIEYLLEEVHGACSVMEVGRERLDLRRQYLVCLLRLLEVFGWQDERGTQRNNSDANVLAIAQHLLGEKSTSHVGILDRLMDAQGILGLHDALSVRLFLDPNHAGGAFFNTSKALIRHGSASAPTTGLLRSLSINALRELSQKIYSKFEENWIHPRRNLIVELEKLAPEVLFGDMWEYVHALVLELRISNEEVVAEVERNRNSILSFCFTQLMNISDFNQIGCGYYDVSEKADEHEISNKMNEYLFDVCFGREIGSPHLARFCHFMLLRLTREPFTGETQAIPAELASGLEPARLRKFWIDTKSQLMTCMTIDRIVRTHSYDANFSTDLKKIFEGLDAFAGQIQEN